MTLSLLRQGKFIYIAQILHIRKCFTNEQVKERGIGLISGGCRHRPGPALIWPSSESGPESAALRDAVGP